MFRVCKTFWIESGHFLSLEKSNCRFPHGHSRKVEIIISAEKLDANGMVCNFQIFKTAFGEFLDSFDHAMLINTNSPHYDYFKNNFERVIGFDNQDPTTEVIAERIFKYVNDSLKPEKEYTTKGGITKLNKYAKLERVRVWETTTSWAECAVN